MNADRVRLASSVEATFRSPGEVTYSKPWFRKKNRLSPEVYTGNGAYSLTLITANRTPWFNDERVSRVVEAELVGSVARNGFQLLAFVFMPEHLHLLVQGSDESVLSRFLKDFKQRTAFDFKRETGEELWQKGSYDHVMRDEEDLASAALYIVMNPVRRGLVEDWLKFPFLGGSLVKTLVGDLKVASTASDIATTRGDSP